MPVVFFLPPTDAEIELMLGQLALCGVFLVVVVYTVQVAIYTTNLNNIINTVQVAIYTTNLKSIMNYINII